MPKTGPAQRFTPLALPDHVVNAMPAPIAEAWGAYLAVVDQWQAAGRTARAARDAADNARYNDQEAAQTAVEAGKPAPPATVQKTADKAERAAREFEAHTTIAVRAERDYVAVVEAHRAEWLTVALPTAQQATSAAEAAVDTAEAAAEQAAQAFSVWSWLRFSDRLNRAPSAPPVGVDFGAIRKRLTGLDADDVEREVAARQAEAEENARLWKVRGM